MYNASDVVYLIPHYNNLDGLAKSLSSIRDVAVLVVDDGSNDKAGLRHLVKLTSDNARKVELVELGRNMGIEHALNEGLRYIAERDWSLIARLDCGDVSCENRISLQLAEFNNDPDLQLVGGAAECVNSSGDHIATLTMPSGHAQIVRAMHFNSAFVHPAVMYKVDTVLANGGYPTNYKAAEDYALFFKFVLVGKAANIPEPIILYEISSNSISSRNRRVQIWSRLRVLSTYAVSRRLLVFGVLRGLIAFLVPREAVAFIRRPFN